MNSLLRNCLAVAVVGVVTLTGFQASAQQNTLRWNLKTGQKFKIETNQDQTQNITGLPMGDMEMKMNQDIFMTWEVKSVEGDKFTVGQTITRIKMDMDSPMMQVEWDSDDEDSGGGAVDFGAVFEPIMNQEVTFVIDSRGNVSDLDVPEDLVEAMKGASGVPGMPSPGPDMLEQIAKSATVVFPEEAVSEESEWEHSTTQTATLEITINSKYKYVGTEEVAGNTLCKIGVTSEIKLDSNDLPNGMTGELDEAASESEIWFNNDAGFLAKTTSKQKMVMLVTGGGQEMDVDVDVETTVKMTPVKD